MLQAFNLNEIPGPGVSGENKIMFECDIPQGTLYIVVCVSGNLLQTLNLNSDKNECRVSDYWDCCNINISLTETARLR